MYQLASGRGPWQTSLEGGCDVAGEESSEIVCKDLTDRTLGRTCQKTHARCCLTYSVITDKDFHKDPKQPTPGGLQQLAPAIKGRLPRLTEEQIGWGVLSATPFIKKA